jgi:hypothetical protein
MKRSYVVILALLMLVLIAGGCAKKKISITEGENTKQSSTSNLTQEDLPKNLQN